MNTTGKYEKHGLTGTRIHSIWKHMLRRCYRPDVSNYKWYGAKGVKVCERWHSLVNFHADMGHPPQHMTIDRIDSSKDYEPGNCRWLSIEDQQRNRCNNRWIEFRGERKLMSDWARGIGMKIPTLHRRLKDGMSVEEALTRPVGRWA